jgi:hypothetical protein
MKCSKCGRHTPKFYNPTGPGVCWDCSANQTQGAVAEAMKVKMMPKATERKQGDVWRIPKTNSPMFTEQWGYQGSGKLPYIISRKDHADAGTTADRFCCSCPAFTSNGRKPVITHRDDCKHILKVKLFEGIGLTAVASGVSPAHAKEYAEFLKQKAQKKLAAAAIADTGAIAMEGDDMGRKFR